MLDKCANSDCSIPFDYKQGQFFRFPKACAVNEAPANAHSVQHFWLCGRCARIHTLQYHKEHGVAISPRLVLRHAITTPGDMYHGLSVGNGEF
jgi:hypothetical protein